MMREAVKRDDEVSNQKSSRPLVSRTNGNQSRSPLVNALMTWLYYSRFYLRSAWGACGYFRARIASRKRRRPMALRVSEVAVGAGRVTIRMPSQHESVRAKFVDVCRCGDSSPLIKIGCSLLLIEGRNPPPKAMITENSYEGLTFVNSCWCPRAREFCRMRRNRDNSPAEVACRFRVGRLWPRSPRRRWRFAIRPANGGMGPWCTSNAESRSARPRKSDKVKRSESGMIVSGRFRQRIRSGARSAEVMRVLTSSGAPLSTKTGHLVGMHHQSAICTFGDRLNCRFDVMTKQLLW